MNKSNPVSYTSSPGKRSLVQSMGWRLRRRGQAMVEFALVATVAMIVLFVAIQLALIGECALALGQMNYQGARWAAVNTCATPSQVLQYITYVGSPTVVNSGGTCGSQLTMTITDSNGTSSPSTSARGFSCGSDPTSSVTTGCTTSPVPRTFGTSVQITLSFDASKEIFLYGKGGSTSKPWLGLINLPTTLSSSETAMAE